MAANEEHLHSRECPKCDVPLEVRKKGFEGTIEIDVCPKCAGIWLDRGELDHLDDCILVSPEQIKYEILYESPSKCPACKSTLHGLGFPAAPAIRIEKCLSCRGLWVDESSLEKIRQMARGMEGRSIASIRIPEKPGGHPAFEDDGTLLLFLMGCSS